MASPTVQRRQRLHRSPSGVRSAGQAAFRRHWGMKIARSATGISAKARAFMALPSVTKNASISSSSSPTPLKRARITPSRAVRPGPEQARKVEPARADRGEGQHEQDRRHHEDEGRPAGAPRLPGPRRRGRTGRSRAPWAEELLRVGKDAALGDDGRDEVDRGQVEGRVPHGHAVGDGRRSAEAGDLAPPPLLDLDLGAREVQGRAWRSGPRRRTGCRGAGPRWRARTSRPC